MNVSVGGPAVIDEMISKSPRHRALYADEAEHSQLLYILLCASGDGCGEADDKSEHIITQIYS